MDGWMDVDGWLDGWMDVSPAKDKGTLLLLLLLCCFTSTVNIYGHVGTVS